MNRRRYLQWVGAGATTALAGCWETGDGNSDREDAANPTRADVPTVGSDADVPVAADGFERALNAVEAGADAEGDERIDPLVREHASAAEDRLLVFPDGRYRVGPVSLEDVGRFGMVAAEDATPTLVPAGPTDEIGPTLLQFVEAESVLFGGFAFDFRQRGFGGKLHVTTTGDLAVRNVRVRGQYPADAIGFHFAVESEDGVGLVENVSAPDGGPMGGRSLGAFVDRRHAGELTFRNCSLQNFPNNGLYASAPGGDGTLRGYGGVVRVLGGLYRNNNIANVRLGGHGAVARNVTVVVNEVPPYNTLNARGLLFRNGTDHRVENCRIVLGEETGESLGAVVFHPDAGKAFVRNTRVEMDHDDVPAVRAPPPSAKLSGPPGPVFENVAIRGTAGGGDTVVVADRDDTELRNCRVVQSGDDRDGIRFADSEGCLVSGTTIDVTGEAIQNRQSSVTRRSVNVVR